jgi:hypothetical protein
MTSNDPAETRPGTLHRQTYQNRNRKWFTQILAPVTRPARQELVEYGHAHAIVRSQGPPATPSASYATEQGSGGLREPSSYMPQDQHVEPTAGLSVVPV